MKFDKEVTALDPVEIRQNFFILGLIGDREVNLVTQCPRGVSSFGEHFTFTDILFSLCSVGIYTPKTVFVQCAS